jgi:hypothetical protein
MTRTGPADAVMSACARTGSNWSAFARPVSHGPASVTPAARSCQLRPVRPRLQRQRAGAPHQLCPGQPAPVHPLYLDLLLWHAPTHFGWSFDPGRDVLCMLILPLRWPQWP